MYECVICLGLNHASHLHCQYCGTIPAQYSITGKPIKSYTTALGCFPIIHTIAAFGCSRASQRRAHRIHFRTVPANYYAQE
jgi:hypothetical protein